MTVEALICLLAILKETIGPTITAARAVHAAIILIVSMLFLTDLTMIAHSA